MGDIAMKSEAPKANQKHNDSCNNKCRESCYTLQKWIRDPNGWIAICTIILVFIGFCALHTSYDTEKRQLRAYVTPSIQSSNIDDASIFVILLIENFGQTPAKNCKISGVVDMLPCPLPKGFVFRMPLTEFEQNSRIYPKATIPANVEILHKHAFTKNEILSNPNRSAYVFGVLSYEDIFGDIHTTNFCYFLNPYSIGKGKTFSWAECDQNTDFN